MNNINGNKRVIAIDLDETLIYNSNNWVNDEKKLNYNSDGWVLIENVSESLKKLYEIYDFVLITARNNDGGACKVIKQIEEQLNIKFLDIVCTGNKYSKAEVAKEFNCEYLIDDLCTNLFDCKKYGVKGIYFTKYDCPEDFLIVKSNWLDITNYLLN
jgi:5'(3')-deoxyribonucleotidase